MFAARLARRRKRLYSSSEHTLFILALFTALRAYGFCAVASDLRRIGRFVFVREYFTSRARGRLLCMFFVGSYRRGDRLSLMIN